MAFLVISVVLGLFPLLGIGYIAATRDLLTVDGLFMSIILLTISGIFFLNALLEWRQLRAGVEEPETAGAGSAALSTAPEDPRLRVTTGVVEKLEFYEAPVGQPNKSILTLRVNGDRPSMILFTGNLRDVVAVGKKVQLTYRLEDNGATLVARREV